MPSHRVRILYWAIVVVCLALVASPVVSAADIPAPITLAFNSGIYVGETIDEAVAAGTAEIVRDTATDTVVRHLWIEGFENDPKDSRVAITAFEVCDTTFVPTVGTLFSTTVNSHMLTGVDIRYVILDTRGHPVGHPIRVTYQLTLDTWTRTEANLTLIDFEHGLSPMARKQLRITSGLLDRYPGQVVVPYADDVLLAKVMRLLGVVVTGATVVVAPEVTPAALAEMAEEEPLLALLQEVLKDIAKDLGLDKLRERLATRTARWGRDARPARTRLAEETDAAVFEEEGKAVWPNFTQRFDGIWESTDTVRIADQMSTGHRFRLEIVGARVTWTERQLTTDRLELRRELIANEKNDGSLTIARPYDEDIIRFQFPNRWADVVEAAPVASTLTLTLDGEDMSGEYVGALISGDDVTTLTRSYDFVNVTWQRPN